MREHPHTKPQPPPKISEAQKRAKKKYQEKMTSLLVEVKKEVATEFKECVKKRNTTQAHVFKKAINDFVKETKETDPN